MHPPTRRLLRISAYIICAVSMLVVVAAAAISIKGRIELARIESVLLTRGEKLSLVALAPPEAPDAQNVFADPLWQRSSTGGKTPFETGDLPLSEAELAEISAEIGASPGDQTYRSQAALHLARSILEDSELAPPLRQDRARKVLALLAPVESQLARIPSLLPRPTARAPIDYANPSSKPGAFDPYPGLLEISRALTARAIAHLVVGSSDAAAADTIALLSIAQKMQAEPMFYSQIVRTSLVANALAPLQAGLRWHSWSSQNLS